MAQISNSSEIRKIKLELSICNPNDWKDLKEAGCYSYAIGLKTNEYYLIGDFIGMRCNSKVSYEELINIFREEMIKIFNYDAEEVLVKTKVLKGEKKIYIQRDNHTGYYHLLR